MLPSLISCPLLPVIVDNGSALGKQIDPAARSRYGTSVGYETASSSGETMKYDNDNELDRGVVTETEKKLKKPPLYKVLLHNDNYTTQEFVVYILQSIFRHPPTKATQIMLHVHRRGIGVAGVYTYEVAETKVDQVHALAKEYEFPLKCTMEEA
jgi:ATP-dependent Clp protease adaptor protein ClpS